MLNKTYVYIYDNAGNITVKRTYALTASYVTPTSPNSTGSYTYGDSAWGDKLTAYNGVTITYDEIGNPLSYYNGFSFTWTGRSLTGATRGVNTLSFTYNDEGIRTSKTVNGVTHKYYLNGSNIIAEVTDSYTIVYIYDENGTPLGMQYREPTYAEGVWDVFWYEKNLQGDIVAVYNASGTKLVAYTYDAWGNHTVTYYNGGTSTAAIENPFRYRGYYYDSDIGLYYLNSRYYDANTGRFINADGYISTGQGILGYNMYAYCGNNPVSNIDPSGESLITALLILAGGALVGGIVGGWLASSTAKEQEEDVSAEEVAKGIAVGAVIGVTAAGLGLAVGAVPSVIQYGARKALFLGTNAIRVWALGSLAYHVMPMILLPFFGIEGESIEYPEPYNTQQPTIN